MWAKMRNALQLVWRQNVPSKTALWPTMSAAQQTKLSWAKPIKSYAAVPPVYAAFFEPFLAEKRAFPYAVLTPTYEGFMHRATEKLICDFGREIVILEKSGNTFEALCYPLERISYVEVRTVLLDSSIKISGVTGEGIPASSTCRFNSVTDHLFGPILNRIRFAAVDSKEAAQSSELEKFDHWARLSFKFMNYAKRSLLAGEKVIHAILQTEIRANVVTVLGKTYTRLISPTHITVLTDRELIMVREEIRLGGKDKYGGIWDFIPLNKIVALSSSARDNNLLVLSIQLPEKVCLEFLFQASAKREIDELLDRFRELTTG